MAEIALPAHIDVPVQAHRLVLGQHEDFAQAAVETVPERAIAYMGFVGSVDFQKPYKPKQPLSDRAKCDFRFSNDASRLPRNDSSAAWFGNRYLAADGYQANT